MSNPDELNPNHPVTQEVSENWHKIAAILLWKLSGKDSHAMVTLTHQDMIEIPEMMIVMHARRETMDVKLVTPEEGERLVREAGGLPA